MFHCVSLRRNNDFIPQLPTERTAIHIFRAGASQKARSALPFGNRARLEIENRDALRSPHDRRHPEQVAEEAGSEGTRNDAVPRVFGLAAERVGEEPNGSGIAVEHCDGPIGKRRNHVILGGEAVERK